MSILAAVVSHPSKQTSEDEEPTFGVPALDPVLKSFPTFLEMLVSRLSSADHVLCANSLQLINALMRETALNDTDNKWPDFVAKLKSLGAFKAVYTLMQGSGLQDLAGPLLDFQTLMKTLLRRWKETPVDWSRDDQKRLAKAIYLAANPERRRQKSQEAESEAQRRAKDPEKWRRLGFESSRPTEEFHEVGYLGMIDLADYIQSSEEGFRRLLLEQSTLVEEKRCPIAKASIAVSIILFDHFEIERTEADEANRSAGNYEKVFKPGLLQWPRLHTAGLQAFFRLWSATGAKFDDFGKIEELVRILIEQVVGSAQRTQEIVEIEQELANYELRELRKLQMDLLELTHEDVWGQHLRQIKDDLEQEALQFMKEQRIRCLLKGAWFPNLPALSKESAAAPEAPSDTRTPSWRFVRLSHNRRYLHWSDFDVKLDKEPALDDLPSKISVAVITEVRSEAPSKTGYPGDNNGASDTESVLTVRSPTDRPQTSKQKSSPSTIIVRGHAGTAQSNSRTHGRTNSQGKPLSPVKARNKSSKETNELGPELPLLTLHPTSPLLASEWLDGLLMLLNQQPMTSETNKLVTFIARYGIKIRMLNVKFEEGGVGAGLDEWGSAKEVEIPTREGLDEDYYYEMPGAA